jgi:hypothetical protein
MRVEVLLAGATEPEPLPVKALVEADLWSHLPADLPTLLALLPRADLYLQDEVQFAFHPTLTRVWSLKGRRRRISRRIVTHNHHRKDFDALLADAKTHFETLTRTPDDLLRHIGSSFAPDKYKKAVTQPPTQAA